MEHNQYLQAAFEKINICLTEKQLNQFLEYYRLLIEKNKVMNLTAITDFEEVVIKHFVDSALILYTGFFQNRDISVIDVGTGAGFPGIPLKILYPEIHLTLLDSLKKRVIFLRDVLEQINIKDVSCIHGRAEDYGHDQVYREKYDLCVSRAVANLSTLSEYCIPFLKIGGKFIAYKSSDIEDELLRCKNAVKKLNSEIEEVIDQKLIGVSSVLSSDDKLKDIDETCMRKFVIVCKKGKLEKRYPRKAGLPSKEPLS